MRVNIYSSTAMVMGVRRWFLGQRRLMIPGILLLVSSILLSGIALSDLVTTSSAPILSTESLLLIHLFLGTSAVFPFIFFLTWHWWSRRHKIGRHPNARYGYLTLVTLITLFLSGLALVPWTNWTWLRHLHGSVAVVLVIELLIHSTWRWRKRLAGGKWPATSRRRRVLYRKRRTWVFGAVSLLLVVVAASLISRPEASARSVTIEGLPVRHNALAEASVPPDELPAAIECGGCHSDLVTAWQGSSHAQAAIDPYYQALATLFIQERGVEAVRYCAGCHNPLGLMRGEIDVTARVEDNQAEHAYEARALGVRLAISPAAAEGVTCIVCHRAMGDGQAGTLNLAPAAGRVDGPMAAIALRARPESHRAAMNPDVVAESQLCAGCHNLATPDGILLEPTYDEWLASPYPSEGVACQDCHMPLQSGLAVDSTVGGMVVAHGGFPGAPSSLDGVSDSEELLRQAATLEMAWVPVAEGQLAAIVTVTNSGAGHYLPTGADDLRQVWLELTLQDGAGQIIWQSGAPGPEGQIPDGTIRFGKVLGDQYGRAISLHRFWTANQILADTRLAPRETRQIPVDFGRVDRANGPFTLSARLLYRDVPPGFAEFALGEAISEWPVIEMINSELSTEQ